ncbi:MAG: type I polyketide synthase, partial [Planctomycetota bacterium]
MPQPPDQANALPETAIAVVGAACHFPGARNCNEFWTNLRDGVESVHFFTDEELLAAGIPEAQLHDPNFVKAAPILQDVGGFDPAFWGISPKDAAVMDPQHRHFLECSYEALEDAGHDPRRFDGTVGVFGGCGANSYLMFNLLTNPKLVEEMGMFLVRHTSNDKDFLTTFTSYKLELEGPSLGVQTACSTSLVAIHLAAQQLLNGECDMALAGGSTIEVPHHNGYRFEQGEILSPDGHCRPFDAASEGTVFGSGAGVVVLRRLADALDDGDTIRAVIRGSAVNNDGARKAGYLAPSVDGQAHAVEEALAVAEVDAESISYVETHGTGTPVGDPIEVTALTQAFRESTTAVDSCSIGSCKSNIGHTDTAAGVASFLKVVEALRHEQLPPSLHFTEPNPLIEFAGSPFRVQATLEAWPRGAQPRRAGVNSLGVGGTNAHVILEEAPLQESGPRSRELQVLTLSAKTPAALDAACARLADHLEQAPETNLADVAFTLQEGRRAMALRRTVVCADVQDAIALLRDPAAQQVRQGSVASGGEGRTAAFLFPGGGALYADMAADLYAKEPGFRAAMDRGFGLLVSEYGLDLQPLLQDKDSAESLRKPSLQLPAIFLVEVALAELWMSWGIRPEAMLGHSLGENSAACVAGVMSFKDALGLVVLRGQLFEQLPEGGMLSVALSEEELRPLLSEDLVVGVHNTPSQSVVSGPPQALAALHEQLLQGDVDCQFLDIDCAAHSPMLDPILQQFEDYLRGITLSPPRTPMLSNRTGTWLKDEEATDPVYWVEHLRHPVLFAENVSELLEKEDRLLLEVGPGKSLASLARQHPSAGQEHTFLSSLRHRDEKTDDLVFLLGTLGQLWNAGATPDWRALHGTDRRLRIPLPTYPFERQDYWIEPGRSQATTETGAGPLQRLPLEDWFSTETWAPITRPAAGQAALVTPQRWLLFLDRHGLGTALAEKLRAADQEVVTVREGDTYYRFAESEFALSPEAGRVDYDSLCNQLAADDLLPDRIVHLWTVTGSKDARPGSSMFHHNEERGFFSLFFLAQALGELDPVPELQLDVVANNLFRIQEDDIAYPEKSLPPGPVGVMPREFAHLRTRCLDLDFRAGQGDIPAPTLELLLDLVTTEVAEPRLATRNGQVFAPATVALPLAEPTIDQAPLPEHGVVLITGGLGGLGLTIAKHFAQRNKARIVLLGRSPFPEEGLWDAWL